MMKEYEEVAGRMEGWGDSVEPGHSMFLIKKQKLMIIPKQRLSYL